MCRSVPRCLPPPPAYRSQTPSKKRKFSLTSVLDGQKQRIQNKIKKIVTNLDLISFNKDRSHLSRKNQNLMYMKILKQNQNKTNKSDCEKQIQKHGYRFFITQSKLKRNLDKENLNNNQNKGDRGGTVLSDLESEWMDLLKTSNLKIEMIQDLSARIKKYKIYDKLKTSLV